MANTCIEHKEMTLALNVKRQRAVRYLTAARRAVAFLDYTQFEHYSPAHDSRSC